MAVNRTLVKINNVVTDIDSKKPVSIKYQGVNVVSPKIILSDYTDPITLLDTANNNKVLNNANSLSGDSIVDPSLSIEISVGGISLMRDGRALITNIQGNYKINVVSGAIDFYDVIQKRIFEDLDTSLAGWNFTWTPTNISNIIEGSTQVIRDQAIQFPIIEYTGDTGVAGTSKIISNVGVLKGYALIPWIRKKDLLRAIVEQAGFSIDSALDNDEVFDKNIMMLQPPVSWSGFLDGDPVVISDWLSKGNQLAFVKDTLAQYGAYLYQESGIVTIRKFTDFYTNQSAAIDWTDKQDISKPPKVKLGAGFFQNNIYGYAETEEVDISFPVVDHNVQIDSDLLQFEKDYVRLNNPPLTFYTATIGQQFKVFTERLGIVSGLLEIVADANGVPSELVGNTGDYKEAVISHEITDVIYDVIDQTGATMRLITQFTNTYFNRRTPAGGFNNRSYVDGVQDFSLDPGFMFPTFYAGFSEGLIQKNRTITATFNLSAGDIALLRNGLILNKRAREFPIFVEGLGGYFILEKINGFITGRLTSVTLRKL